MEDSGVGPDAKGRWARPPHWPAVTHVDPDMDERGENNGKKRAATLDAQNEDENAPHFELSTDPNVIEDPILWHNHSFPRKNTPKGRVVQWHGEEKGWQWA